MDLQGTLFALVRQTGASGAESGVAQFLKTELAPFADVGTDALGNVSATIGSGAPHILLEAHMDQIGLIVTEIDETGFLRVAKCGGMDLRVLAGAEVTVWGKEPVYGVIACKPPHLTDREERDKAAPIGEVAVDIGLDKASAEAVVCPGDRITFRQEPAALLNGRVTGASMDNRAGASAVLYCLDQIKDQTLNCKVTALFSVQEEIGKVGAQPGAFSAEADIALSTDVSFADALGTPPEKSSALSEGVMIGVSPVLDRTLSKKLARLAKEHDIPYQMEIMGGMTGANADVIAVAGKGAKTALLSIPLRYMHTAVEVVDPEDVKAVGDLMAAYILASEGDHNAE